MTCRKSYIASSIFFTTVSNLSIRPKTPLNSKLSNTICGTEHMKVMGVTRPVQMGCNKMTRLGMGSWASAEMGWDGHKYVCEDDFTGE